MNATHLWALVAIIFAIRCISQAKHTAPDTWKRSATLDAIVIVLAVISLGQAVLS